MHLNTRARIVSTALKTVTSAVACAVFLSLAAHAAGLGKLTVLSSLGQPLRAEIELTSVSNDDVGSLVVKLAPVDAYRVANIEFTPALSSLRFAVEQRGGRQLIRITSAQPVNEPFVDMLLELSWNSGRLVREYTFLLDPPGMRQTESAQVAAPVDVLGAPTQVAPVRLQTPAAAPTDELRPLPAPRQEQENQLARQQPQQPADRQPASANFEYRVKPGDTLGRIAARMKPANVSLDLMLVALYRANPDAFSGNNLNRLRSGQILSMPDDAAMHASGAEATSVVIAHAADFNAYRNKLAEQVARGRPVKVPETGQSASGKVTAKVEEQATPANESKDQLKLSKATPSAAGKSATAEDKIAKDQQISDAAARVKELEKNVSDLEQLMAAKALQAQIKPPAPAPTIKLPSAPKPPVLLLKKEAPPASWSDTLSEYAGALGIAAAALLAGAAALIASRRKKPALSKIEPDVSGYPGAPGPAHFAEIGEPSVDANNSVFHSNFVPSVSPLDTNEVDPVAEADVYIAYGRDAQAEEILKEALRSHPERDPVRLKLLEIYAARKDTRAFEAQANELHSLTRGSGDAWMQAAALGLAIDPLNALYAGAAADAAPGAAVPLAKEQDQQRDFAAAPAFEAPQNAPDLIPDGADAPLQGAVPDNHFLDFDLGGLSTLQDTASSDLPGPTPAAPTPPEPSFDMDFDLPFDAPPEPVAAIEKAAPEPSFDMDFDLPLDTPPAAATPVAEARLPDPLMDLDMMHFEIPDTPAPLADVADQIPEIPIEPEFDLSRIDLDIGSVNPLPEAADLPGVEKLSALQTEMDTKLDLAVAYQEIGDKDGARELIDEVIKDGSDAQVAKANAMRVQLG